MQDAPIMARWLPIIMVPASYRQRVRLGQATVRMLVCKAMYLLVTV